jgi:hypothetical protein
MSSFLIISPRVVSSDDKYEMNRTLVLNGAGEGGYALTTPPTHRPHTNLIMLMTVLSLRLDHYARQNNCFKLVPIFFQFHGSESFYAKGQ